MASSESKDMAVLVTQVAVTSETHPYETYLVQLPYCPCRDFRYRRAGILARGEGITLDALFCKHLRQGLALVGGWHETPEPSPEQVTHHRLTHAAAVTLLTSAYLASDLVDRLLRAAVGANGMAVTVRITNGDVLVKYESTARRYTVTLPSSQPVALPPNWRDAEPEMPTTGLNRATAYDVLTGAGVTSTEARRALREAGRTGHSFAGLPGSGSIPVKHEGGVSQVAGLFTIELPR
jgi:hypothetical protein